LQYRAAGAWHSDAPLNLQTAANGDFGVILLRATPGLVARLVIRFAGDEYNTGAGVVSKDFEVT
jgi:hypothetical protein